MFKNNNFDAALTYYDTLLDIKIVIKEYTCKVIVYFERQCPIQQYTAVQLISFLYVMVVKTKENAVCMTILTLDMPNTLYTFCAYYTFPIFTREDEC